jgi:mRNA-degrading endonuclease RelE of RelBE toxin-antitoxin system
MGSSSMDRDKQGQQGGPFDPEKWPRFVRFPSFTRDWEHLGLDDADLQSLELEILQDPTRAPVIQGTGGLRKIKFAGLRAARGKSGAYRICYVHFPEFGTVALAVIFGKREKDNLNLADRHAISAVVETYRKELEREFGWRQPTDRSKDRSEGDG